MLPYPLRPVRTVAPAATPVTLTEAKAHLRVGHDDEDALITALIQAVTDHLDGWSGVLGRCLVTQTWRLDLRVFPPSRLLRLPFPDLQSVTVAYTDDDGADQTLAAERYHLVEDAAGGLIYLAENEQWPTVEDIPDAVRVTMVAGYGAASAVPASIKAAMLLLIGNLYETREASVPVSMSALPMGADMLLAPYRRIGL